MKDSQDGAARHKEPLARPARDGGQSLRRGGLWAIGLVVAAAVGLTVLPAVAVLVTGEVPWQARHGAKAMQR